MSKRTPLQEDLNLIPYEIDEETGEIIAEVDEASDDVFTRAARTIIDIEDSCAKSVERLDDEIERLKAVRSRRLMKMEDAKAFFLLKINTIMQKSGLKSVPLDGFGVFRYQKGRESVKTEGYDAFGEKDKTMLQELHPELFTSVTKVSPNKKQIKLYLTENEELREGDAIADLFTVEKSEDKFIFRRE